MAWGSKGNEGSTASSGRSGGGALSFIGSEVVINGNVSGQGDLHIDGTVEGDVGCKMLILGQSGNIKGNINADRVTIAGTVNGTINAGELTVEKAARVTGDLHYNSLTVENGAQVDGRLSQRSGASASGELKLVSSGE
jgi:cytoskeletal protein CcmA (bactofilin family)